MAFVEIGIGKWAPARPYAAAAAGAGEMKMAVCSTLEYARPSHRIRYRTHSAIGQPMGIVIIYICLFSAPKVSDFPRHYCIRFFGVATIEKSSDSSELRG